jgi:hypothetical protein
MKSSRSSNPARRPRARIVGLLAGAALALAAVAGCAAAGGQTRAQQGPPVVFGRQASELAVGVTTRRTGGQLSVAATVLGQDGTGRVGLAVSLAERGGAWVHAAPCGAGRYCGELSVAGARPELELRLRRPAGRTSTVSLRLPARPDPARAAELVRAAERAVRGLSSVIVNEHLSSGPAYKPLLTQFTYEAPDRLAYQTSGAGSAVVIGDRRWDRAADGQAWEVSAQEPISSPGLDWRRAEHAALLGSGTRDGRPVWRVSFYDPTVPAWLELDVDKRTELPLRLEMTAAAHFMTHDYRAFNAPLPILPPA